MMDGGPNAENVVGELPAPESLSDACVGEEVEVKMGRWKRRWLKEEEMKEEVVGSWEPEWAIKRRAEMKG